MVGISPSHADDNVESGLSMNREKREDVLKLVVAVLDQLGCGLGCWLRLLYL